MVIGKGCCGLGVNVSFVLHRVPQDLMEPLGIRYIAKVIKTGQASNACENCPSAVRISLFQRCEKGRKDKACCFKTE